MVVISLALPGCIAGSLATSTGPKPPDYRWSTAWRQAVHVGETVQFDFILKDPWGRRVDPVGVADYCSTDIGRERIDAEPDIHGHFQFSHRFTDVRSGDRIKLETIAFRQRGGRDFMKVRGEWLHSDSPFEESDRRVASDSVILTVYEVPIDLAIPAPVHELEVETGVLTIRRDGATASVYVDRQGRPGFTLKGPDADRSYHVRYLPAGDEINATGTTDVNFVIYDTGGQRYEAGVVLDTP
jgi:hypothetical protein